MGCEDVFGALTPCNMYSIQHEMAHARMTRHKLLAQGRREKGTCVLGDSAPTSFLKIVHFLCHKVVTPRTRGGCLGQKCRKIRCSMNIAMYYPQKKVPLPPKLTCVSASRKTRPFTFFFLIGGSFTKMY